MFSTCSTHPHSLSLSLSPPPECQLPTGAPQKTTKSNRKRGGGFKLQTLPQDDAFSSPEPCHSQLAPATLLSYLTVLSMKL
jgi:hypothetical protein